MAQHRPGGAAACSRRAGRTSAAWRVRAAAGGAGAWCTARVGRQVHNSANPSTGCADSHEVGDVELDEALPARQRRAVVALPGRAGRLGERTSVHEPQAVRAIAPRPTAEVADEAGRAGDEHQRWLGSGSSGHRLSANNSEQAAMPGELFHIRYSERLGKLEKQ